MADKKIIAVIGATGAQGGGLVQAILADPAGGFAARAITRKPDSDQGRALAAAGAEVVAGDSDDVASLERAFAGADGAFCVTNFWEHGSPERELGQAANLARAAKAAGVAHVVWSTLEDTRTWVPLDDDRVPTLRGKYKVPHFDAKGEADADLPRRVGADHVPAGCLLLGQLHRLRHGSPPGGRRHPHPRPAARRRQAARHRRQGHRPLRLRHLPARPLDGRPVRGHRRRRPQRPRDGGGLQPRPGAAR